MTTAEGSRTEVPFDHLGVAEEILVASIYENIVVIVEERRATVHTATDSAMCVDDVATGTM